MYVIVENPGLDAQREVAEFETYKEARKFANIQYRFDDDDFWDIQKRLPDGSLTTEI